MRMSIAELSSLLENANVSEDFLPASLRNSTYHFWFSPYSLTTGESSVTQDDGSRMNSSSTSENETNDQGEGVLDIDAAVFMIPDSNLRSVDRELIKADANGSLSDEIRQPAVRHNHTRRPC